MKVLVVGAGVFGLTGALTLAERGHAVRVLDPGPVPHPLAASTDISKLVRPDYGDDVTYSALMERAWPRWQAWSAGWPGRLLHDDGFLVLSSRPLSPGTYEGDSFATLSARGHALERLDAGDIAARFPDWAAAGFVAGYRNPAAGWVESGNVVAALAEEAKRAGIVIEPGVRVTDIERDGGGVIGVRHGDGQLAQADLVVVAAGAWTPALVPALAGRLRVVGQPVFHLAPADPERFAAPRFLPWAADIGTSGWYGFPANEDGLVKIANHGGGVRVDPDGPREIPAYLELALRAFLAKRLPALADAPVADRRLCLYCDSFDGDLWISADPQHPGLVVAAGGSGHGFKFAPVLGELIADAAEGRPYPRFAWRPGGPSRRESARASAVDFGARWNRMWAELGATPDPALYSSLMAAWASPGRVYHGRVHLLDCLLAFDALRDLAAHPAEVELALWFHDAVYEPLARDNEERSAAWALEAARDAQLAPEVLGRLDSTILATRHAAPPEGADQAVAVDADLAILGAPPGRFAAYEAQIRAEYGFTPDDAYAAGRGRVMRRFVSRPRIFTTDRAFHALETRARENLARWVQG